MVVDKNNINEYLEKNKIMYIARFNTPGEFHIVSNSYYSGQLTQIGRIVIDDYSILTEIFIPPGDSIRYGEFYFLFIELSIDENDPDKEELAKLHKNSPKLKYNMSEGDVMRTLFNGVDENFVLKYWEDMIMQKTGTSADLTVQE